ncbi:MAG: hypothetical protein AAGI07_17940 [Bacteroidota bacterium]
MNTFYIPFAKVENIFHNMSNSIAKSAILFVLMKQQEYYEKAEENEINETAFLSAFQYICKEVAHSNFKLNNETIKMVLELDETIASQKNNKKYWQFLHLFE